MLQQIDRNIWCATQPLSVFGFKLGTRMTVIRLEGEKLFIHSPIALSDELKQSLSELGEVAYVVAPNLMHHLFLVDFVAQYPNAEVYAPSGIEKKQRQLSKVTAVNDLSKEKLPWGTELEVASVEGMPLIGEYDFYHPETKTLLTTDLVFHFPNMKHWWTRSYLKFCKIDGKCGVSKLLKIMVKDKIKVRESIDRLLEWDFERLIMAHGEIIDTGGREQLREAYSWL